MGQFREDAAKLPCWVTGCRCLDWQESAASKAVSKALQPQAAPDEPSQLERQQASAAGAPARMVGAYTPKMQAAMAREITERRKEKDALHPWPCLCDDCMEPGAELASLRVEKRVHDENERRRVRALTDLEGKLKARELELRIWREAHRALEIAAATAREFIDAMDAVRALAPDTSWQLEYPSRRATDPQRPAPPAPPAQEKGITDSLTHLR